MSDTDVHDLPHDFPRAIARPATRALLHAGINSLAELATHSREEIAALHGMGPKALGILDRHLAELGLQFADEPKQE